MKVTRKDGQTVEFGTLQMGDVFKSTGGDIFIKINELEAETMSGMCSGTLNAVALEDGEATFFYPDENVIPLKAELIVE